MANIQPTYSCCRTTADPQQAGFRKGKSINCQFLNMTQRIVDGFEKKLITRTVFVDCLLHTTRSVIVCCSKRPCWSPIV